MATVKVRGVDQLYALSRALRQAGRKDLDKELRRGVSRAVRPFGAEVKAEARTGMPSGYAPLLAASLSVRTQWRAAGVTVVTTAKGSQDARDIEAIDGGTLRHPVFGRRRRRTGRKNPWVAQRVRAGFWTRPAERLQRQIVDEVKAAVVRVTEKVISE